MQNWINPEIRPSENRRATEGANMQNSKRYSTDIHAYRLFRMLKTLPGSCQGSCPANYRYVFGGIKQAEQYWSPHISPCNICRGFLMQAGNEFIRSGCCPCYILPGNVDPVYASWDALRKFGYVSADHKWIKPWIVKSRRKVKL